MTAPDSAGDLQQTATSATAATAAAAIAAQLPTADPALAVPVSIFEPSAVVPGPDAVGIAVRVSGDSAGELVLLVCAPLADALLNSVVGNVDDVAALEPLLLPAVEALQAATGLRLEPAACRRIDVAVAADTVLSSASPSAAQIRAGEHHVASLLVGLGIEGAATLPATAAAVPGPRATNDEFRPLGVSAPKGDPLRLQLLHEVPMAVTVQLGSTRMTVRELLALTPGSVVELDRAAGSPVDVLVNGTLLARGEVVVVDEEYAVRISEIVSHPEQPSDSS
jgi:flagellar motor switch protein FliN/FliY